MSRACGLGAAPRRCCRGAAAGCGDADERREASTGGELVVSAASSLEPAFTDYVAADGIDAKMSFAGSDDLAAQIRQGVTPDVYAAANTSLPDELYDEGLVDEPVVFATNTLVLAVPGGLGDRLARRPRPRADVTIAIGDEGVPVGDYTREVLGGLPADQEQAILANVGSHEPDVAGIVGKLTQGAVDAGFVYVTRRRRHRRRARRDRPAGRRCSRTSPTGPRWSRAPRTPTARRRSSTACSTARARQRSTQAGFGPPTLRLTRCTAADRSWSPWWRRSRLPSPFLILPVVAIFADTPRRADRQPRQRGVPRRALAQPEDHARRADHHRRRRHPCRLPARDARVPRQGRW